MSIEIIWSNDLKCSDDLKLEIKNNFQNYIAKNKSMQDCHNGNVEVLIQHTGPLNRTLNGQIICESGKIFEFSSSQDGRSININN